MAQKMDNNFKKRFGDRISVSYLVKSFTPAERETQNTKLYKAIRQVMVGILKREPTQEELLGLKDISEHNPRRKN
ncbi:MAG: hypothetical protein KKD29_05410 [Candidatus Omnitrophica bacterium]|nr:hypothetical protein [Candidatus Omnitrophota bacterium]